MSSDLWQQAKKALNDAMLLEGQSRHDFLQSLESQSPELAAEVKSLLAASEAAEQDEFLAKTINPNELDETVEYEHQITDSSFATVAPSSTPSDLNVSASLADFIGEDYEIHEQLGKGGMGIVYKAYQQSLRRYVALKIIPDRLLKTPDEVARFKIEAESAAKLDHPGIVPVYEVGERCGVNYYSMALVEGKSLSAYVGARGERLEQRQAAEIMEQVCHAVQYAHDRAVIHRDLKPDNILLDKDNKPRLTDFGLAKALKEDEGLTMTGQVMGTPRYMAPEQATGNLSELSTRTDVYSLGSTLYALLAGRPPFGSETILQTIKEVAESPPPPLSKFSPHVAPDLQTICEKCLAKRPADRYESASDMAADLRNYLDGYPIAARPLGRWMRSYLWCRRNPVVAALITITATTLLVAAIVSTYYSIQAQQQLALAKSNAQKLNQAIEDLFVFASENILAEEPGMQAVRKTLLESAQRYYQDLIHTGQTSIENLAHSAFLLGRVQASLGDSDAADTSFETAADNYLKIVENNQINSEPIVALAQVYNEHARLHEKAWHARPPAEPQPEDLVDLQHWQDHAKNCVSWRSKAVESDPENYELQRLLANAKMNLGLAITDQGRIDNNQQVILEANQLLEQAQAMREKLHSKHPEQGKILKDISLGYASQADLRATEAELTEDPEAAHNLWLESLQLRTQAATTLTKLPASAVNVDTEWLLATCYQVCAESRFRLGDFEAALTDYQKMSTVMQRLLLQNPRVQRYRLGLAQSQYMQSQLMLALGDSQGFTLFEDCQQTLVDAIAIDPRNQAVLDQFVDYSVNFAAELAVQKHHQSAIQQLQRALQLLTDLQIRGKGKESADAALKLLREEIDSIQKQQEQINRAT